MVIFILSFQLCSSSHVHINTYIYIYMCVCVCYVYLLELKDMKGCEALRHRFPFCGIESFFNSSLSLYIYLRHTLIHMHTHTLSFFLCVCCRSVVRGLFLSLSLLYFLFVVALCSECFCKSPCGK